MEKTNTEDSRSYDDARTTSSYQKTLLVKRYL